MTVPWRGGVGVGMSLHLEVGSIDAMDPGLDGTRFVATADVRVIDSC